MKRTITNASQMELNDKVVAIKGISKTVEGGYTMRFPALVVVGDGNGHIGTGLGKAGEVPGAIRKGKEAAIKNLVETPVDENESIPHDFTGKFGSAAVLLKRAPEDTGVIAGGPACFVLEMAGIKNIRTKSLGSNNKANTALITLASLTSLKTPEEFARLRDKSVEETVGQQEEKDMAGKLKTALVKSPIGAVLKQKATVKVLGLIKMHKVVEMPDSGVVRGMIAAMWHLVEVEEV